MRNPVELLASALDAALPQTQCTRCGYPDCKAYALAMAEGAAGINQCPPGGQEGVSRLARLTGQTALPLNPEHGREAARQLAVIDEAWCIGCTLCLKACPVDCIVGGPKLMHTVIESQCTGCELCIPACPVDCISLRPATGARTGWDAWSAAQALEARQRYAFHRVRLERDDAQLRDRLAAPDPGAPGAPPAGVNDAAQVHAEALCTRPADSGPRKAVIDAALARARAARSA